uniref:Solute carrier family 30 member 4 n=1 Tax=Callorhinchus milii TaxID=7868 RepID=A0A4W3JQS8_CALMI|eukprot:gi/632938133/ref/XP_007903864.1/ PREDICTED: zinc transporter 4 [Callorhinchus milii]
MTMARSTWDTFKSYLRKGDGTSHLTSDTVTLDFSDDMVEEEDDLPKFGNANQLRVVASDMFSEIAHVPTLVCNGSSVPSVGNPDPQQPYDGLLSFESQAGLQIPKADAVEKCDGCTKTRELMRQRTVKRKLWIAITLYALFTIGEFLGGFLSNSLAVMTDAVHMLADVLGIAASLFALYLSGRSPSKRFTFGWHRFEAMAAIISVILIYCVTVWLVFEAIQRTIHQDFEINADVMIIIAAVGVAVNIIMGFLLNQSSHLHSHSHSHSHGLSGQTVRGGQGSAHGHNHSAGSLAVRAAFIHALGDLLQSVGVLVAAYIIRFKPEYKIADPICTYIFSFLVLCTTLRILRDTGIIFLEGSPSHLDVHCIREDLLKIEDVYSVEDLNVWSLTVGKTAAIVHLKLVPESFSNWEEVQCKARQILMNTYGMHQCTVQLQSYRDVGNNLCTKCRVSDNQNI